MSRAAGNKNSRALACLPTTSSYYTQQHLQKHKDSLIFSLPAHISLSVPPSSSPPLTFYHHKHPVDQSSSNSFHSHFTSSSSSHSLVLLLISILPDISFLLSFFPPIPASILICSWLASCWETLFRKPLIWLEAQHAQASCFYSNCTESSLFCLCSTSFVLLYLFLISSSQAFGALLLLNCIPLLSPICVINSGWIRRTFFLFYFVLLTIRERINSTN